MLSVVILSYNRCQALRRTLRELSMHGTDAVQQVIVVDNASTDGSADMVAREFPHADLVRLGHNIGVAGFNRGVQRARGELILTLDDDSWPDPDGLSAATALLDERPGVGAVALLPRHPLTNEAEWRHAEAARGAWPVMGCGNLIRADVWRTLGGYEEAYFLYRNDTDLALKMLSAGFDVWFDPRWVVWHDSAAAGQKSERWLRYATRNWAWLARRHGRGTSRWLGLLAGFAWASRLAGWSPVRQWCVLQGAGAGLLRRPPPVPEACLVDGVAFKELVRVQLQR